MLPLLLAAILCHVNGPLPDPRCTPGAVLPVTAAEVCVPGYSKHVRSVTVSQKRRVYRRYGIAHHKAGEFEVDHLISLELGGSNDIKNLWPEAACGHPLNENKNSGSAGWRGTAETASAIGPTRTNGGGTNARTIPSTGRDSFSIHESSTENTTRNPWGMLVATRSRSDSDSASPTTIFWRLLRIITAPSVAAGNEITGISPLTTTTEAEWSGAFSATTAINVSGSFAMIPSASVARSNTSSGIKATSCGPGFHEKDWFENYLHSEVCAGRMELKEAQQIISTDWLSYYQKAHK